MKVYVGQAKLIGPISRYAGRFNFLELGAEPGRCPRPSVLKQWREAVPNGFVFAVRLARAVGSFDAGAEDAIVFGLRAAEALDARWLVLQTPATFGPGQRNRERLKKLFERLLQSGRHVAWDPRGVWDESDILPVISEVDVQWARDASRYEMVEEPLAYSRIPALGTASRVGLGLAERAGENLRGFEEVYVVIEGEGAGRAAHVIREIANQAPAGEESLGEDGVEELSMQAAGAKKGDFERRTSSVEGDAEEFDEDAVEFAAEGQQNDEGEDGEFEDEDEDGEFEDEDEDGEFEDEDEDGDGLVDPEHDDGSDEDEEKSDDIEDPEMLKPDKIDDSDLPWAPGKKGKRSR